MTGGTGQGVVPQLDAADLVTAVPALSGVADLSAESFLKVPGAHLTLADMLRLRDHLETVAASDVSGVVITQGTDTIDETSFALDLLGMTMPTVVTGAMRPPQVPGADGPANLLAAVQVAANDRAAAFGVVVMMNDEIHLARAVAKRHTSRPDAFQSPARGPVGTVSEDTVYWHMPPPARVSAGSIETPLPRVHLVPTVLGDDGSLLEAVLDTEPDGLVIEAMGAGHVPSPLVDQLERAADSKPVVLTSRVGAGHVFRSTYGFPGSERDLLGRGLIWGGNLTGPKARILLTFALATGATSEHLARQIERLS